MPGQIGTAELLAMNFYVGAGGQWYRNNSSGNGDHGDNHTHLIGTESAPGYNPTTNPNPATVLTVSKIEFKIRLAGRPIKRVWLIRTPDGDFLMPHMPQDLNAEERRIARNLYDVLPPALSAE
jgi:hypothetical protein